MAIVQTNTISLLVTQESALGTAGTTWQTLEPNSISRATAEITTVPRAPITADRQRRKGESVDLDSGFEAEFDLTMEHLIEFLPGMMFAIPTGNGLTAAGDVFRPTAVTSTGYTVPTGGNMPDNTLVYARGFPTAGNNGLKVLAGTSTSTEIKCTGLTADASVADSENATVSFCGRRGASGDITMDSSGRLTSTLLDFTTIGLTVGQVIKIAGFATAANNGYARVSIIAANLLTFDRTSSTFATDSGAAVQIDLYFGRWYRNVATTHANYTSRSYTYELFLDNLDGGTDAYIYPAGNYLDEVTLNFEIADKATMTLSTVGTDTPVPTTSRKTGASSARVVVQSEPFNNASDFARLMIANSSGVVQSTYFKSLTLTVRNNMSANKILGQLGALAINTGLAEVDIDMQLIFDDPDLASAVRNNSTVEMAFVTKNGDGGFYVDIPSMTVGDGSLDFPVNESVLINLAGKADKHATLGCSVSFSLFPYLP